MTIKARFIFLLIIVVAITLLFIDRFSHCKYICALSDYIQANYASTDSSIFLQKMLRAKRSLSGQKWQVQCDQSVLEVRLKHKFKDE